METKRLVLAFALSAAVLIGWTLRFPAAEAVRTRRAASCDRARGGAERDDGRPGDANLCARRPEPGRAARTRDAGVRGRGGNWSRCEARSTRRAFRTRGEP